MRPDHRHALSVGENVGNPPLETSDYSYQTGVTDNSVNILNKAILPFLVVVYKNPVNGQLKAIELWA